MSKIQLHDAELKRIDIDAKSQIIQLEFCLENGRRKILKITGVRAFRAEDLIMQNIISRILLHSHGDIGEDGLGFYIDWVAALSDCKTWFDEQTKSGWQEQIRANSLELIVFEPSAGAQIVIICKKIEEVMEK